MKSLTKRSNTLYPKVKGSGSSYEIIPSGDPQLVSGEYLLSPPEARWGQSYHRASHRGLVINFDLPPGIYIENSEYFPVPELPFVSSYTTMIERVGDLLYIGLGVLMTSGTAPYGEGNRRVGTYNIKTGEWIPSVLSYFPMDVYGSASGIIDGKLITTAGYAFSTSSYIPHTYVCDLNKSNLWMRVADRDEFNLGVDQRDAIIRHPDGLEYFHVFGGYNVNNAPPLFRHLQSHFYYDPRNDVWVELPEMPVRLRFPYYFSTETAIYVFGGSIEIPLQPIVNNTDVFRYTFETGWEVVAQADLEVAGVWHNANAQGNAVIVGEKAYFEAYSQGAEDYETYVSSIDINTFELEQNVFMFPSEEYYGKMIEVDGAIYYVGAYAAKNDYSEGSIFYFIKV